MPRPLSPEAAELAGEGFTTIALSPGHVATDLGSAGGRAAPLTAEASIAGCIDTLLSLSRDDNGKLLKYDRSELPW